MLALIVFGNVWWLSIRGGVLKGHLRWVTMLAFLLGMAFDGEWLRLFELLKRAAVQV